MKILRYLIFIAKKLGFHLKSLYFIEFVESICKKYLSHYYRHLFWKQWHKGSPEWFDHRIDLYRWQDHLNPNFVERGIY